MKLKRPRTAAQQERHRRRVIREWWANSPLGRMERGLPPLTEAALARWLKKMKWDLNPAIRAAAPKQGGKG